MGNSLPVPKQNQPTNQPTKQKKTPKNPAVTPEKENWKTVAPNLIHSDGIGKGLSLIHAGEHVEKREPSHTVGGNVSWCSHYREQYGGSLKN